MCCGPCSVVPLKQTLKGSLEVCGFFYNPNIHPRTEFIKRLESVRKLSRLLELAVISHDEYDPAPYFARLGGTDKKSIPTEQRCASCYHERLRYTAKTAKQRGFDFFTTSLLYSKYQNHELIVDMGLDMERKFGIPFYYEDFREGWKSGIEESRSMELYRQKYCGCIFSLVERELHKRADSSSAKEAKASSGRAVMGLTDKK